MIPSSDLLFNSISNSVEGSVVTADVFIVIQAHDRFRRDYLPILRRTLNNSASRRLALPPETPAISLGQQAALASNEGMVHTQTKAVQETAILIVGI